jgi:hypothetical protein
MERTEDDKPRVMPNAEREERRDALDKRLPGVKLEGELDPSHSLINACAALFDDNIARYIEWNKCHKLEDEAVSSSRKRKLWEEDDKGFLKVTSGGQELGDADTTTELRLSNCLQRRAIAMDVAGLMSYECGEEIRIFLLDELQRPPPDERYAATSLEQIRRADKEIFSQIGKTCRKGVRPDSLGALPMNEALPKVLDSHRLTCILAPLPKGGSYTKGGSSSSLRRSGSVTPDRAKRNDNAQESASAKRRRLTRQREASLKTQLADLKASSPSHAKGAGQKAGGKGRASQGPRMPEKLIWPMCQRQQWR